MHTTERVATADWPAIAAELEAVGCALTQPVLDAAECAQIAGWYDDAARFRSTVDMARFRFGSGQYRYFDRPYPPVIQELRAAFYSRLLPVAREWAARLGRPAPWPDTLDEWLAMCHEAGQRTRLSRVGHGACSSSPRVRVMSLSTLASMRVG